jgi:subtilisin-like proprotein convertase family protein
MKQVCVRPLVSAFCIALAITSIIGVTTVGARAAGMPQDQDQVSKGDSTPRILAAPGADPRDLADRPEANSIVASSGNIAVPIPDVTSVNSTIVVPSTAAGTILDVNVRVRLNHTFDGDLDMVLTSPDGTAVKLVRRLGETGDNFGSGATDCSGTPTTFDDEAGTFVEAGAPPFAASYRPQSALAAFKGKAPQGTWTLRVSDAVAPDTGTLFCWQMTIRRQAANGGDAFINNGYAHLAVWRPGSPSGTYFLRTLGIASLGSAANGIAGDIPVPADYNGGIEESFALFRPSTGAWINALGSPVGFGVDGDIPVPGDYNGDGVGDIAVFRPSDGVWYLRNIGNTVWGINGDIPVPADYNGDGVTDLAVFRAGVWYVNGVTALGWGTAGDIPVPADYDGDGKADFAIFRPSSGTWYITTLTGETVTTVAWGINGDIPIAADYDGDGKADIAVWRPTDARWYIRNVAAIIFGAPGDIPITKRPTYPGYPF